MRYNEISVFIIAHSFLFSLITTQDIIFEDLDNKSSCISPSGLIGECTSLTKCPHILQRIISSGDRPKICYFENGFKPIICCPSLKEDVKNEITPPVLNFDCGKNSILKLSRQVLSKNFVSLVGVRDSFVSLVGGHDVTSAWPWMALIGQGKANSNEGQFFCNGALINERFILSAAHCFLEKGNFFVRLGEHDYEKLDEVEPPEDIDVETVYLSPGFNPNFGYNDLAILKMKRDVIIKDNIRPICLPWDKKSNSDLVNQFAIITGWGAKHFGGRLSPILQKVGVIIFNISDCEKGYSQLSDFKIAFPDGFNLDNMICAGDRSGGKDSCQGDSGAPLMLHNSTTDRYTIAAVVSKGYGCGLKEFPGLYAPIRNHLVLQWIKDIAFT